MAITTDIYNLNTDTFIRESMKNFLSRNWWWIAFPVIISIIIGIGIDTRFLFISAMIIFLIIPTTLMIVYFNQVLSTDARKHIIPRYITIDESSIIIFFTNPDPDNHEYILPDNETVPLTDIISLSVNRQNIIITFTGGNNRFIIIPSNAFKNENEIASAINMIYSANQKR